MGANTAIFTLVDKVLLRFLPVRAPEELCLVMGSRNPVASPTWNDPDYAAFREH